MGSRASKLFGGVVVPVPDAVTTEGYPAYERTLKDKYLQLLLTNTLGNTYYASQKELVDETKKLHPAMLAEDVEFMVKACVYARNEGFMRTQPIYGLATLCAHPSITSRVLFGIMDKVLRTPKDLSDFTSILSRLRKGQGGRKVKRAAGQWLAQKMTPYWAIKYGAEKDGDGYSLRDLLCVYHPKTGEPNNTFNYLMGRGVIPESSQLFQFERLKKATDDADKIGAIISGRLPHEVASTFAGKSVAIWDAIVKQLPTFALLRHLATLEKIGIIDNHKEWITAKLSDAEGIKKAKIFPFRFLDAFDKVKTAWVSDALRMGLEASLANLPGIPGSTTVLIDVSGSMNGEPKRIAAIFAIALAKRAAGDIHVLCYDDNVYEFLPSKLDSVLTQVKEIEECGGGGTNTGAAMSMVGNLGKTLGTKMDNIVLITDEQQNQGTPFYANLVKYRDKRSPQAKCFVLNVAPYTKSGAVAPFGKDPLSFALYGWNENALSFISMASKGFESLAHAVASRNE